ncbi:hypothetical protein FQA39_LY15061 [Lamprigera yunnana]|nr:hypothetical protein FQA39_LY15061 [Lamprigera yunnana]
MQLTKHNVGPLSGCITSKMDLPSTSRGTRSSKRSRTELSDIDIYSDEEEILSLSDFDSVSDSSVRENESNEETVGDLRWKNCVIFNSATYNFDAENSGISEIQFIKKMWMLYAQEHWTKAFDLKSAVEQLYEELGALEFGADHEAIYGMERYYTVQQCEELRDKYKIGRKVCRKFLQGKTCSQCLVKRISEIGLRHFFDTINKYIKDCSDSSLSSDEEVFKAVEQNGEETTEEEE